MEEGRTKFKILIEIFEWHRRRWENNIRMDLKKIGVNMRNWVNSAHDRDYWRVHVNVALNLRIP